VPIGPPLLAFAQIAVAEKFAMIRRVEVVAAGRGPFLAIAHDRSDSKDDGKKEGKNGNQQLAIIEVVHRILLCI
jgi:hypothetical protein